MKLLSWIRKIHAYTGITFAIFFITSAISGIILVFRNQIPKDIKEFFFTLHTWEWGILKYWVIVVGIALIGLSISGTILFFSKHFIKPTKKDK
ncbi:MAG: hypothetical protein ABDH21_04360 [bacterium]